VMPDPTGLLYLLLWIVIVGLVFYVLWWGLGAIGLEAPFDKIARAILVIAMVICAVYFLVSFLPLPHRVFR